ncbi:MAG: trypsin-like peptidase domain-containing protein, partial [Eubacteriales bacterium]|nr:trypsin-like peptidase domain-containing protein [Eubacteriales bacterium]
DGIVMTGWWAESNIEREKSKKENKFFKFIKVLSLRFIFIFASFVIGIVFSFSYIFLKDIVIPKFANDSVSKSYEGDFQIQNVSSNISSIIENVKPSIVSITTLMQTRDFFNNITNSEGSASGIIFHKTATEVYIVTNYHVISNATAIGVAVEDNKPVYANLIAKDVNNNLAILSVSYAELKKSGAKEIKVAKFADSSYVLEGDYVIGIGNALGQGNTATFGMISATSRDIVLENRKLNVIQTTAAINPGNSGGALINLNGEVIGINTSKIDDNDVEGIGYSISSNVAMPLIEQMMNNTNPATLGVEITDASAYPNAKYKVGALIVKVNEGSSAERAGLLPYDIVTSINETPILNSSQLVQEIKKYSPKDTVKLNIIRDGEVLTIKVRLLP